MYKMLDCYRNCRLGSIPRYFCMADKEGCRTIFILQDSVCHSFHCFCNCHHNNRKRLSHKCTTMDLLRNYLLGSTLSLNYKVGNDNCANHHLGSILCLNRIHRARYLYAINLCSSQCLGSIHRLDFPSKFD